MALYDGNGKEITVGSTTKSPIEGKRILMVGDSNVEYYEDAYKQHMESTYGCTFIPFGTASCKWLTTEGADTLTDLSAVGKVNQIIANVDENGLITEYDYIVIMMGTNDWSPYYGSLSNTSEDVSASCGAMRYCMEKLVYHGRNIPIGYVVPPRTNETDAGGTFPERFELFKEIARQYGIPTLDLFNNGRVIADAGIPAGSNVYLKDTLHFGEYGRKQFLHILGKWIAYAL